MGRHEISSLLNNNKNCYLISSNTQLLVSRKGSQHKRNMFMTKLIFNISTKSLLLSTGRGVPHHAEYFSVSTLHLEKLRQTHEIASLSCWYKGSRLQLVRSWALFFLHLSPTSLCYLSADQHRVRSLEANVCITSQLHPSVTFISSMLAGLSFELQERRWSTTIILYLYCYENASGWWLLNSGIEIVHRSLARKHNLKTLVTGHWNLSLNFHPWQ